MAIEGDIKTVLDSLAAGGCHRGVAPDGTIKPYITFQIISDIPVVSLKARMANKNKRVQIDMWDDDIYGFSRLGPLQLSIETAMDSAAFTNIPLPSIGDGYEEETKMNRITLDYSVWST